MLELFCSKLLDKGGSGAEMDRYLTEGLIGCFYTKCPIGVRDLYIARLAFRPDPTAGNRGRTTVRIYPPLHKYSKGKHELCSLGVLVRAEIVFMSEWK